jgi:hypothetical protein
LNGCKEGQSGKDESDEDKHILSTQEKVKEKTEKVQFSVFDLNYDDVKR